MSVENPRMIEQLPLEISRKSGTFELNESQVGNTISGEKSVYGV